MGLEPVDGCEKCGRAIGKLENAHVWKKHAVCPECADRLKVEEQPPVPEVRYTKSTSKGVLSPVRALLWIGIILWIPGALIGWPEVALAGGILAILSSMALVIRVAAKKENS